MSYTHEWVTPHIWLRHVTWVMLHPAAHALTADMRVTRMHEWRHTYIWVMSHIRMSHSTHVRTSFVSCCKKKKKQHRFTSLLGSWFTESLVSRVVRNTTDLYERNSLKRDLYSCKSDACFPAKESMFFCYTDLNQNNRGQTLLWENRPLLSE